MRGYSSTPSIEVKAQFLMAIVSVAAGQLAIELVFEVEVQHVTK